MKKVQCPLCKHVDEINVAEGQTVHRCASCKNLVRIIDAPKSKSEVKREAVMKGKSMAEAVAEAEEKAPAKKKASKKKAKKSEK